MTDDQQRARELQIATLAESSRCLGVAQAKSDNDASEYWFNKEREAIAALRAAPEGFVMVPVEPTEQQVDAGIEQVQAVLDALGPDASAQTLALVAYDGMIAARPQEASDA